MQTTSDPQESWPLFYDAQGDPICRKPDRLVVGTTVILYDPYVSKGQLSWIVLCHQRADNGLWGFVGGAQEIGESLIACAIREAYEETGYRINVERMVCVDSDPNHGSIRQYPDGHVVQYTNVTFTARCQTDQTDHAVPPRPSVESQAMGWYFVDMLPQPFSRLHAWRLQQALAINQHPPVR